MCPVIKALEDRNSLERAGRGGGAVPSAHNPVTPPVSTYLLSCLTGLTISQIILLSLYQVTVVAHEGQFQSRTNYSDHQWQSNNNCLNDLGPDLTCIQEHYFVWTCGITMGTNAVVNQLVCCVRRIDPRRNKILNTVIRLILIWNFCQGPCSVLDSMAKTKLEKGETAFSLN